jgi:hypothetical protein
MRTTLRHKYQVRVEKKLSTYAHYIRKHIFKDGNPMSLEEIVDVMENPQNRNVVGKCIATLQLSYLKRWRFSTMSAHRELVHIRFKNLEERTLYHTEEDYPSRDKIECRFAYCSDRFMEVSRLIYLLGIPYWAKKQKLLKE